MQPIAKGSHDGSDGAGRSTLRRAFAVAAVVLMVSNAATVTVAAGVDSAGADAGPVASATDAADSECSVALSERRTEEGIVLEGTLSDSTWNRQCGSAVVDVSDVADGNVTVTLHPPEGADFDLYLTLDGRAADPYDYDRRSAYTDEETPTIELSADEVPEDGKIGVAVDAYRGAGRMRVVIGSDGSDDGDGGEAVDATFSLSNSTPYVGQTVTLDASGTTAPDGATYEWKVDGERVGKGVTVDHSFDRAGAHTVSLLVETGDGDGDIARKKVRVRPGDEDGTVEARLAVSNRTPRVGQRVLFDASNSTAPGKESYTWRIDGETVDENASSFARAFDKPGAHTVSVRVETPSGNDTARTKLRVRPRDDGGDGGDGDELEAVVTVSNTTPRVGQEVTIDGSETVVPNGTGRYQWLIDGKEVRKKGETFSYTFEEAGTHNVVLRVKGPDGGVDADRVKLRVRDGGKKKKVVARIDVLSDDSVFTNETLEFSAARSHGVGGINEYVWTFGDGTTKRGETVKHTFDSPGNYSVSLRVVDEGVGSDTAKERLSVVKPKIWIKEVEGAPTRVLPDELFARCPDPVSVTVAGSEPVDGVAFTYGRRTVTDEFGSNGWSAMKSELMRGANRSEVVRITAVGVNGTVDSRTVRVETAKAPGALGLIASGLNNIARGAENLMNASIFKLGLPPVMTTRCKVALNYPQIAGSVRGLANATGTDLKLPSKVTNYFPKVIPVSLYGRLKMQYRPFQDQTGVGGGLGLSLNINPLGESNVKGGGDVNGFFSMPAWKLQRFESHAYVEANVYLEEYISPVPIPSWNYKIPGTPIEVNLDPVDVRATPRLDVAGEFGDSGEFDLSTFQVSAKGSFALHGQLGESCWANFFGLGCVGLRAWINGSLESDYIGVIPPNWKSQGKATVGGGVEVNTPSAIIPDYTYYWEKQWTLGKPRLTATAAASVTGGAAFSGRQATDPTLQTTAKTGHGDRVGNVSPGQVLTSQRQRSDSATAAAAAASLDVDPSIARSPAAAL